MMRLLIARVAKCLMEIHRYMLDHIQYITPHYFQQPDIDKLVVRLETGSHLLAGVGI